MKIIKLLFIPLILFVSCIAFAQDVPNTAETMPPWENTKYAALVALAVSTALGLLQKVVHKIPGFLGKVVTWLVDVLSANVKHK